MGRLNFSSLQKRIFSAIVMASIVIGAIYVGGWMFLVFVNLIAMLAVYEWSKLALKTNRSALYLSLGFVYIIVSLICCYLIRADYGVSISFLFVIMVWASDIGAYFTGKTFGGPKLAEKISPKKTWSGYAGALLFPAAFACIYALVTGLGDLQPIFMIQIFMIGALMGVAGQAGDLLVSWFKRRVNVKDTGDIIPGHGGILDRIDSLLLCAPVFLFAIRMLIGGYSG